MNRFPGPVAVLLLPLTLFGQQRDAPVAPVGAAEISGVVMSAEAQPRPIRRAVVSISGGGLPSARSVITDDAGRFAFTRLPAGSFTVMAKKAAYLPAEHGSPRPGRPGSRVALAAGERRSVSLTMFKGAVIAGTLRDPSGAPLAGVSVAVLPREIARIDPRATGGPPPPPQPEPVTTDDRGAYRIYGLMPGEYVVSASPTPGGAGEIGARSAAEMDTLLSALSQRQNRTGPAGAAAPPLPPLPATSSIGYAPVYFPGTPLYAEAARIRVAAGEERDGVNFQVSHVPVSTIEGVVSGNVPSLAAAQLAIIPDAPRVRGPIGPTSITSQPPDAEGAFKYGNLAPGRYRIVARARAGTGEPGAPIPGAAVSVSGGLRAGAPPSNVIVQPTGDMLYAVADVDVRGQDVKGVSLVLQPGGTVTGKVVFDAEAAPIPDDLTAFRVGLYQFGGSYISSFGSTRVGNALGSLQAVNLEDDGSFTINGVGPDVYYVSCMIPAPLTSVWKMRSAIVDGRDLLDTMVEGPAVQLRNVVITLSDRRTELSGTLQSAAGQPVSDYYVVAFSANRAHWRLGSRRSVSTRPSTDGRFTFADLPAGDYFVAALTDLDPIEWQDASFLEQVAPAAVKVALAEGEKKTQDLRIR